MTRAKTSAGENTSRRKFLQVAGLGAAGAVAAPYIRNAEAAETTVWKVQTSWPAGVGLQTFKDWAGTIKEKTGGELEVKPFAAKEGRRRLRTDRWRPQRRARGDELVHGLLGW